MKNIGRIFFIAVVVFPALLCMPGHAGAQEPNSRFFQAVEFLAGFSQGELEEKGDYNLIPFMVDLDYNLKALTKKIHLCPPGLLQFQIEPFVTAVTEPKANLEVGNSFFLKVGFLPDDWALQPYIRAGVGVVFMTQHASEQSTQFNYIESYVIGAHYFFNKRTALTLEGRFRHLSNADRKYPNHGINTYGALAGILYQF